MAPWRGGCRQGCGDLAPMIQKLFVRGRVPPHIFAVVTAALMAGGAILIRVTLGERLVEFLPLIALFAVAVRRLFPLVGSLGQMRLQIAEKLPVAELIDEELQRPASLEKREHSEDAPDVEEGVRFERVSLEYREGTRVLDRVTLTVRAWETTALVGPSGAGQSSVGHRPLRMSSPIEGRLQLDAAPLDRPSR